MPPYPLLAYSWFLSPRITRPLLLAMGAQEKYVDKFIDPLNAHLPRYGIITKLRQMHFLSQILHESGGLQYTKELASGAAYEGRKGLGNKFRGDGVRFKGRGLIQITGRANYAEISKDLGIDYVSNPAWLERPNDAVLSALWYWDKRGLNLWADRNSVVELTKRINGGVRGLADRVARLLKAKKFLDALTAMV